MLTETAPTTAARTSTWQIDPAHTHVEFAVKHMMIATVKGRFASVRGSLELDEQDVTRSRVEVVIDATSIDTRNDERDGHLRSADFLDAEGYEELTFRSRRVEAAGEGGALQIIGDLTIRGVRREVRLDAKFLGRATSPWGQDVMAWTAHAAIDRRDWGLTWNRALETGGVLVANEVRIQLEVEAIRQADEA